jgi:peptidoglycan/LPS O-acetylase OafA/YrhL
MESPVSDYRPAIASERLPSATRRPASAPERLAWLDALRCVAILGVMLVHTGYVFPALGRAWVLGLGAGRHGVDLFFSISGFLFAELMLGRQMGVARYLGRRALRIAAVYYAAMLVYVALEPVRPSARTILLNLAFLNPWCQPTTPYLVEGGWSICAEIFFYFAGIALLRVLVTPGRALLTWSVALAGAMLLTLLLPGSTVANEYSALISLPTFLGGVLCWHFRAAAPRPAIGAPLVLACLAFIVAACERAIPVAGRHQIGCVCVLATWGSIRLWRETVLTRAMAALGKLSYSAYAFHFAVLSATLVLTTAILPVRGAMWHAALLEFGLLVLLTFPLAFLVFRYLETPVASLLRTRPAELRK